MLQSVTFFLHGSHTKIYLLAKLINNFIFQKNTTNLLLYTPSAEEKEEEEEKTATSFIKVHFVFLMLCILTQNIQLKPLNIMYLPNVCTHKINVLFRIYTLYIQRNSNQKKNRVNVI